MDRVIQIAGIRDRAEADMLVEEGVTWLGFPFRLAFHKEDTSEAEAAAIIRSLPQGIHAVAITYLRTADTLLELCERLGTDAVQVHGDIAVGELARLKATRPALFVIKSLVVRGDNIRDLADVVRDGSPHVDAFITDTYDPRTGACGATGLAHDWNVSRRLVELSPRPVVLAGGLNAGNVSEAIRRVRPAGVDAHTGVEDADGRKSRDKVRRFVAEAHKAFPLPDP